MQYRAYIDNKKCHMQIRINDYAPNDMNGNDSQYQLKLSLFPQPQNKPCAIFYNILKTGANFLSALLINWKMEGM